MHAIECRPGKNAVQQDTPVGRRESVLVGLSVGEERIELGDDVFLEFLIVVLLPFLQIVAKARGGNFEVVAIVVHTPGTYWDRVEQSCGGRGLVLHLIGQMEGAIERLRILRQRYRWRR